MSPLGGKGDAAHAQEDSLGVKKEGAPAHSSVQFSRSVASDSLGPHGLQHTRLPCPSSTPGAYSMPKPLLPIPQRPLGWNPSWEKSCIRMLVRVLGQVRCEKRRWIIGQR